MRAVYSAGSATQRVVVQKRPETQNPSTIQKSSPTFLAEVTEIDVRQNPDIDEASLAALRAAAEETGCTILADDD